MLKNSIKNSSQHQASALVCVKHLWGRLGLIATLRLLRRQKEPDSKREF